MAKSILKYLIASILAAVAGNHIVAQDAGTNESRENRPYIQQRGEFDFFCGLDFNYRDVINDKQTELLVNLTPGLKWMPWPHTTVEVQAWIPVVNHYGKHYRNPRMNIMAVSHEMKVLSRLALKPSLGFFSQERWGMDVKAMYPLRDWIAFEAEIGYTGYVSMTEGWQMSKLSRAIILPGVDFYIPVWNTQVRVFGGHFLHDDTGLVVEAMRHFRHYTIEAYAEYSSKGLHESGMNGGFKLTFAIPPYHRSHKRVNFRPASTFCLSHDINADARCNRVYETDPEQNSRTGWFLPDIFFWGHNRYPDIIEK